ncbi:MAG TPA: FAD-dependent oxidoreductase [Phycisphaerae bacterium]|nr:FAD-dependent oxidoreductase [Phycisphaerae bacterium]
MKRVFGSFGWLLLLVAAGCAGPATQRFDVVVYGGTAGGTVAAIAAAREGASVALLEPRRHIGGMVSGGLGQTDHANKAVIGGMAREFFVRVGRHYNEDVAWHFEPHVAERVFRDWLKEAGVRVFFHQRLDKVDKVGRRIERIRMESGAGFAAPVFIDATYEGDLMARAGVAYVVGREGRDEFGESLAGVVERSRFHQFDVPISAYDRNGKLLPCVYSGDKGKPGQGDRKVQAYNFRVCLSNRKDNQLPLPRPPGYDPARYEVLKRYFAVRGKDLKMNDITIFSLMPNGKTDINNRGPFSSDHIGANWDYPEADYARREEIWNDHVNYVQGFLYFLAHDPCVPKHLQDEINKWGLPRDEYADNGHWSHQLYVREARRMRGQYVMTQKDMQEDRVKSDSIGMGSFMIDSHHVQRVVLPDGTLENEGDIQVPVQPYEIPYRALVPMQAECDNLLVPVCMSATHVAYGSLRMEPQYMIMGQACGVAAARVARDSLAAQQVDIAWLQERLRGKEQILSSPESRKPCIKISSLPGVVVDNPSAQFTGTWTLSAAVGPFVGDDYLHDDANGRQGTVVRFVPALPKAGAYEVRAAYTPSANRATRVKVSINTADGLQTRTINQKKALPSPPFLSLGTFQLNTGSEAWVEIDSAGADGYVVADAVQWIPRPAR